MLSNNNRSSCLSHSGFIHALITSEKSSKRRIQFNKSLSAKGFVNNTIDRTRSRGDSLSLFTNTPNLHYRKTQVAPSMEDSNPTFC